MGLGGSYTMTKPIFEGNSFITYQKEAIPSLFHDQGSNIKKKKRKEL